MKISMSLDDIDNGHLVPSIPKLGFTMLAGTSHFPPLLQPKSTADAIASSLQKLMFAASQLGLRQLQAGC